MRATARPVCLAFTDAMRAFGIPEGDGNGLTCALPSSNSRRRGPHRGCAWRSWQISASISGSRRRGPGSALPAGT